MNITRTGITLWTAALLLAFPAGCLGAEGELADEDQIDSEPVEGQAEAITSLTSKTIPPGGLGVTFVGGRTYRIKNDLGQCAYRAGGDVSGLPIISTQACDTNADVAGPQKWAIYEITPGNYSICQPETLRRVTKTLCSYWTNLGEDASMEVCDEGGGFRYRGTVYEATCVNHKKYLTSGDLYRMSRSDIAYTPWDYSRRAVSTTFTTRDTDGKSMGLVQWDGVGRYLTELGRRWTRNSGGEVVPGRASGNADQKWGFFN